MRPASWYAYRGRHLCTVFAKLGIRSRKELRAALPELQQLGLPA